MAPPMLPHAPALLSLKLHHPIHSCYEQNQAEIEALTAFKLNLHDPLKALNGWDPSTPTLPVTGMGLHLRMTRSPSSAYLASNSIS
ncbi:hypothetical protein SLEP1_g12014 [Rubroshorea leprosula]|nr:hypothetical protein SLEP1_g12014 [Rubroshorea leprosula]